MKCPICGKQTLPGAKLCGPCRAALKRAKDDSVWELPPSQRPGEAQPAEPQPVEARSPRFVLGAPRLSAWQAWMLGVAMIAACAGGVLVLAHPRDPAPTQAAAAPLARPIVVEPANAVQQAIPASTQPPIPPVVAAAVAATDAVVQPERHDHTQPPRAAKSVKPALEPPPAPTPAPPPVAPPPEAPVAAPPPPAARPVDPWQRMQDALNRCSGEALLSRLGCEYRVRASYCEGHWGEVAQCPAQFSNDHGQ